ncbi:UNVERIFIED_CONTAM: hypothetical protein K2H54_077267 [Gekko kuhli]
MLNAYYISHNAAACLEFRGFPWSGSPKKKKKGKGARRKQREREDILPRFTTTPFVEETYAACLEDQPVSSLLKSVLPWARGLGIASSQTVGLAFLPTFEGSSLESVAE